MIKIVKVNKKAFIDGLDRIGVLKEGKLDIYTGFQIRMKNGELQLAKINKTDTITETIQAKGDNMLVSVNNYKQVFKDIKLMDDNLIQIEHNEDKNTVVIADSEKSMEFKNEGLKVEEEEFEEIEALSYNSNSLLDRLNEVDYAVDKDGIREFLGGIHFNGVDMVASDGYRLALSRCLHLNIQNKFTITNDSVTSLKKLLRKYKGEIISIKVGKKSVQFGFNKDTTKIECRKIEEDYFNYKSIIRENHETKAKINLDDIKRAVKYLATLSGSTGRAKFKPNLENHVILKPLGDNKLEVELEAKEGIYKAEIETQNTTINHNIAFNIHYMLDAVNKIKDEQVYLGLAGEYNPLMVENEYLSSIHLVLPVRINR